MANPRQIWPQRNGAPPFGQVFKLPGGATGSISKANALSVTVTASGDLESISEWVVKICPVGATQALQQTLLAWQVFCQVEAGWGDAVSSEYESNTFYSAQVASPLVIPVRGKVFQVHGNTVRAKIWRTSGVGQPDLSVMVGIMPGMAVDSTVEVADVGGGGTEVFIDIPVFATEMRVLAEGGAAAGDQITFRQASSAHPGLFSVPLLGDWVPLPPRASVAGITLNGAAVVEFVAQFKVQA